MAEWAEKDSFIENLQQELDTKLVELATLRRTMTAKDEAHLGEVTRLTRTSKDRDEANLVEVSRLRRIVVEKESEMRRIVAEKEGAETEVARLMMVEAELKERMARKVTKEMKKDKNLIKIVHQLCRPSTSSASSPVLRLPSPEILTSLADLNPSPVSSSSYQLPASILLLDSLGHLGTTIHYLLLQDSTFLHLASTLYLPFCLHLPLETPSQSAKIWRKGLEINWHSWSKDP